MVKSDSIIEKLKKGTFSFDGKVITLASPSYGAYTKFATETANLAITVANSLFEDKNMYFECVGVLTSDVRRRSLHLGDHRLGARHGHRDRRDHQGLHHRRYSWHRRRGSDDR